MDPIYIYDVGFPRACLSESYKRTSGFRASLLAQNPIDVQDFYKVIFLDAQHTTCKPDPCPGEYPDILVMGSTYVIHISHINRTHKHTMYYHPGLGISLYIYIYIYIHMYI